MISPRYFLLAENIALFFSDELLEEYTDSELARHIFSSPKSPASCQVFNLPSYLIAKQYRSSELEDALKAIKVASQLGIRCPSVRKTVNKDPNFYLTIKLALQLRRFVKIPRSVTSPTAGSIVTGECRSFYLENRYGLPAHSGPAEFAHFFRFWTNFINPRRAVQEAKQLQAPGLDSPVPLTIKSFVLTHHGLAARNLIVFPSDELWLEVIMALLSRIKDWDGLR
ncbi:hypothetical protein BDV06DRAFT_216519 [Aspergillus oleicola]